MKKEVSMVLSVESTNYRKLAQTHYNLTAEQMMGMHVHHNPPRHQGGRNIPEHLYVYHPTLHNEVHQGDFTSWASNNGVTKEQAAEWGALGGRTGGKLQPREVKVKNGLKCKENKLGFFALGENAEGGRKGGKVVGKKLFDSKTGMFGMTKEEQTVRSQKAGKTTSSIKVRCTVTGHISNPGALTRYQTARGINTSNREKIL
jgi:hypothetical protein